MNCPRQFELRYVDVDSPLPPELPIMLAGGVVHEMARRAAASKGSWRAERRVFFKSPRSLFDSTWGLWSRTIKEKEQKIRGIRWKSDDPKQQKMEFANLGSFIAKVLSGLAWVGPEGQRELREVHRGFYNMVDKPRIPFEAVLAERTVKALFQLPSQQVLNLAGKFDQIWWVAPCPEFPDGGFVIVDLTLGSLIKHIQLTMYSLIFRLALKQDPRFRKLVGLGPEDREEAVAVLWLSPAKLSIFRQRQEHYENLAWWLDWASCMVIEGVYRASPTDEVCSRCIFNHTCEFAATTEVLDLGEGGAYVVTPIEKPPSPRIVQTGFKGLQRGKGVWGTRTLPFVFPRQVLTLERE